MKLSISREMWSGFGVLAIATFVLWEVSGYPIGGMATPGPGFFPLVLGIFLVALGIGIVIEGIIAVRAGGEEDLPVELRSLVAIGLSIFVFFLLLNRTGLVPATIALVVVSSAASRNISPLRVITTAIVLAAMATGIFIYGFGLPLRAFHWG